MTSNDGTSYAHLTEKKREDFFDFFIDGRTYTSYVSPLGMYGTLTLHVRIH